MDALINAFKSLGNLLELDSDVITLRNGRGGQFILIEPDWIDGPAITRILAIAREGELAVSLTREGMRIEEHDSSTVLGVESVKQVLREKHE